MGLGSSDNQFHGDKKFGTSLLMPLEEKLVTSTVAKVPRAIETNHLTLMTIVWSGLVVLFSYLAQENISWLWLASFMIVLQYITDLYDGAVGRFRHTGLVKWGYYMDHFLDYVFLASILIGYSFIAPADFRFMLFFILAIYAAFMVNSFLAFAATGRFRIAYMGIGASEIRVLFVVINTLLIFFGKTYMGPALPAVLLLSLVGLVIVVYKTQKEIWAMDMEKERLDEQSED